MVITMRQALRLMDLTGAMNSAYYELGWEEAVEYTEGITTTTTRKITEKRRRQKTATARWTAYIQTLIERSK